MDSEKRKNRPIPKGRARKQDNASREARATDRPETDQPSVGPRPDLESLRRETQERERVEAALRQSEREYRHLVESAHDAILIFRPEDEVVLEVNQRACELYGFGRSEFIGMSLEKITHDVPRGKVQIQATLDQGFYHHFESVHYRKDGSEMFVEINGSRVNYQGRWAIQSINRDITERKRAEEALREAKETFETFLKASPEAVMVTDLEGTITFASPRTVALHGYASPEEMVGRKSFQLIPPEEHGKAKEGIQKLLRGEPLVKANFTGLRKDGSRFVVEINTAVLRDAQGAPKAFMTSARDVTERQRAEEALRESEEAFRLAFEGAKDAIFWADPRTGLITNCNKAAEDLLEKTKEEIIGQHQTTLHPPQKGGAYAKMFERHIQERGVAEEEAEIITKSGKVNAVHITASVTRVGGKPIIQGIFRDITERKRAEEVLRESEARYRLLAENVTDLIWMMDLSMRFTYLSPSVTRLTGYSVEEALSFSLKETLTPPSFQVAMQTFSEEMALESSGRADPARSRILELEQRCKDGSAVAIEVTTTFLRDSQGRPVGILGVSRDITARKRAEEDLRGKEGDYRTLAKNSPDLIARFDRQLRHTYVNPAAARAGRLSASEYIGKTIPESGVPEPAAGRWEERVRQVLETGQLMEVVDAFPTPDGIRYFNTRFIPELAPDGSVQSVLSVARDITERKRVEEALRRNEALLTATQTLAKVGGWEWDVREQRMFWTDELYRLHDFPLNDPSPGSPAHIEKSMECYDPADRPMILAAFKRCAEKGESYDLEFPFTTAGGRRLWIRTTAQAVRKDGKVIKVVGDLMDITERKRVEEVLQDSEEKYRLLVENSQQAILVLQDGKLQFANPRAVQHSGYSLPELTSRPFLELVHPEDRAMVAERYEKRLKGEAIPEVYQFRFIDKQGRAQWVEVNSVRLTWKGRPAALSFLNDIEERRKTEEGQRFLLKAATDLIEFTPDQNIYLHVAERLRELAGNFIISVTSFDESSQTFRTEALIGLGKLADQTLKLLGRAPVGMTFPIHDRSRKYLTSGRFEKVEESLYELTFHQIPAPVCEALERLYEYDGAYAMGFTWEGKLFGGCVILGRKGMEVREKGLIETFIRQASKTLQRKRAEEALRASEAMSQAVLEHSPVGISVRDQTGVLLQVNEAWKKIWAISDAEIRENEKWSAGRSWKERCPYLGDSGQDVDRLFTPEGGVSILYLPELKIPAPRPGAANWISMYLYALRNQDGRVEKVVTLTQDITERQRVETALQDSEVKYRLVVEHASDAILVAQDGMMEFVNPKVQEITGYSEGELTSRPFPEFIHPEDRQMVVERHQRRLQGKPVPPVYPFRIVTKAGEECWVEVSAVVISWKGKPATLNFLTDITERRKAEEALRKSEAKYRELVENANSIILRRDPEGRITFFNEFAQRFFGFREEEILGRNVVGTIVPEKESSGRDLAQMIRDISRHPERYATNENENVLRNGERVWVAWTNKPILDPDGKLAEILCIGNDITERKRAEERLAESEVKYRTLVEGMSEAVMQVDNDDRVQFVNPQFCQMIGYREDELLGRVGYEIYFDPEEQEMIRRKNRLRLEKASDAYETRMRKKTGEEVLVRISGSPVTDAQGNVVGSIGVITDITERKLLEAEFLQAQKMEAFGRLAGGVAHDFNNLLTSIMGYSDLLAKKLAEDDPSGPLRRYADIILSSANRAANLTQQLLSLSRRHAVQMRVLDLNEVVAGVERILRGLIREDIELTIHPEGALGRGKADSVQIEQVLMNLAVNALDAMPRGGRLSIRTANVVLDKSYARRRREVAPGPYVMIAVSDTGHGMDAEVQSHLFEPFFTTKEKGKGTGLGLSTAYGIVQQMGGHIEVESALGKGSAFKIYLPRTEEPPAPLASPQPRPPGPVEAELPRGVETVLLAEDEETVRSFAREVLRGAGYTVLEAGDGEEALRVAGSHPGPIHLLLTDVIMPRLGGPELARRLQPLHPDMRVLFMSGYTDGDISSYGGLGSETSLLQKPFQPMVLARRVREVLEAP